MRDLARSVWQNKGTVLLLSLLAGILFLQQLVLSPETPFVVATTNSMEPTFEGYLRPNGLVDVFRGDLLLIVDTTPRVGDSIVFRTVSASIPIVHRVVALHLGNDGLRWYATKGDNNPVTDVFPGGTDFGWVPEEDVLGVVAFVVHDIGWFVLETGKPYFFVLLLLLAVVLAVLCLSTRQENKQRQEPQTKGKKEIRNQHVFRYITLTIVVGTLFTPVGIGLVQLGQGPNQVLVVQRDGSPLPNSLSFTNERWPLVEHYQQGNTHYSFINVGLKVTSSGPFNWVNTISLTVSIGARSQPTSWYHQPAHSAGTNSINATLVVLDLNTSSPSPVIVELSYWSTGLFHQQPRQQTIELQLGP